MTFLLRWTDWICGPFDFKKPYFSPPNLSEKTNWEKQPYSLINNIKMPPYLILRIDQSIYSKWEKYIVHTKMNTKKKIADESRARFIGTSTFQILSHIALVRVCAVPTPYLNRTICASSVHLLCIICDKQQKSRYLKREGRLVNNKYKDERICSSLRSGNNSKPEFTDPDVMTILNKIKFHNDVFKYQIDIFRMRLYIVLITYQDRSTPSTLGTPNFKYFRHFKYSKL
jgi:hypothetical protein